MVRTQVIAILCGSHSRAQESEDSSWEKMHIVSMEIGSVGNCMFSQVFNTIYIQEITEASLYIGINAGLVEIEANQMS